MRIVRRHHLDPQLPLQPEQGLVNLPLVVQPLVLNFKEEIPFAEDLLVPVSYTHLDVYKRQLLNRPPTSLRAFITDSIAFPPTFFTAARPNRIDSPSGVTSGVNCAPEVCTSGGSTLIPISRHSPMYFTTLSGFDVSEVSSAAMNLSLIHIWFPTPCGPPPSTLT